MAKLDRHACKRKEIKTDGEMEDMGEDEMRYYGRYKVIIMERLTLLGLNCEGTFRIFKEDRE
jgi:hypothetical protein